MIYQVLGKPVTREEALKACEKHTTDDFPIEAFEALFRNAETWPPGWTEDACWLIQTQTNHDVYLSSEKVAA